MAVALSCMECSAKDTSKLLLVGRGESYHSHSTHTDMLTPDQSMLCVRLSLSIGCYSS